ncbi:MAG: hypothetical protein Q7S87_01380 [Agitococcus sp.]|nr:hypothetical protein [Agitococcus sp.]
MSYITLHGKLVKVHKNRWTGKSNVPSIINDKAATTRSTVLKGKQDGNCNVTACQKPGATWWNTSTRAYYCANCASEINRWSKHDEGFDICYSSEAAATAANAMFSYKSSPVTDVAVTSTEMEN